MGFSNKLVAFLVKKLAVSNKEAKSFIEEGRIMVNSQLVKENVILEEGDEVKFDDKIIREIKTYTYVVYYKPRGVESTLNEGIENNLRHVFLHQFCEKLFPVGRLDKDSEGLMLFTDHGNLFNRIIKSELNLEKEYEVVVDKEISDEELKQLAAGIVIMGELTKPAEVLRLNNSSFTIILTQGLNRQIRRMCYKLNFEVIKLTRTRIVNLKIKNLKAGEHRRIEGEELSELLDIVG